MNTPQLIPFAFGDHLFRSTVDEYGNLWFVAKDICRVLEIENSRDAVSCLDDDEKITVANADGNPRAGVPHQMTLISESGMYSLVFRSRKPEAKAFSKWVRTEVLPALRKTGTYTVPKQARRKVLPEGVPAEVLLLRPTVRQRLWQDALQTARLDNAGTEAAQEWFVRLCQLMTCDSTKAEDEGLINAFMDQCLESSRGRTTSFSKIYAALQLWWDKNGIGPVPGTRRASDMIGVRFQRHKSSVSTFRNCALRT